MSRRSSWFPGSSLGLLVVIAVCAIATTRAYAQMPESAAGRTVGRIEVRSPAGPIAIDDVVGPFVGRALDRDLVRELIAALLATERFADIQIDLDDTADPVVLEVRVAPRLRVSRIDVHGNHAFSDSEIRDQLGIAIGDDIDRTAGPRLQSALLESYRERGYESTEATVRILDTVDETNVVVLVELVEGDPTRVSTVRFSSEPPPDWPSPLRGLRSLEGDRLDLARLERARSSALHKLREVGYFEATIGEPTVTRDGSRASIDLALDLGHRYEVVVTGHAPLSRGQVTDALELADATLDDAGRASLASRAADVFHRAGFSNATARVSVEHDSVADEHFVVVEIDRGPAIRMRTLRFVGAEQFSSRYLREQVETFLDQELRDTFGAPIDREVIDRLVGGRGIDEARRQPESLYVPPEQIYYPPTFERAIEHLETLYKEAGFIDVAIDPPQVTELDDDAIAVTIVVREGPRTRFHDVVISGNAAVTDEDLAEALDIERGSPFSDTALANGVERLLDHYRSRGFLYATVIETVRFSADRTNAVVELTVNERFEVRVGHVRIEGARQTRDSLIRSLVALEPGDRFTSTAARRTEERLLELGIFGSVVVAPADPDVAEPVKDIVVTVAERMPQVLDFGAGVSTGQGVRGSFEYSYRNLFGRAITFTLRAQLSGQFFFLDPVLEERFETLDLVERLERRVTTSIVLPILGRNPNFRASFNILNLRDNTRTFGIDKSSFDVTVSYRPSRRFSLSLSPSLERNNVELLVSDQTYEELLQMTSGPTRQLLLVPQGKSTLAAIALNAIIDRRDNPFSPTRGFYLSSGVEWARTLTAPTVDLGTGIDETFRSNHLRLTGTASTYVTFYEGVTLALQAKMGGIVHVREYSDTFPNRQFFLGGVDTMRSYRQDAMIPQDVIDRVASTGVDPVALVQGGEISLLLRTEMRFPVFGDLSAAVFGEFGNLWADARYFEPWRLRPSVGLGVRLDTPVGPIALDYGFNVLYRQEDRQAVGERIGAFNFSIGVF